MRAGCAISREEDVNLAARDACSRALDAADLDSAGCLIVTATPEHLDEAVELCEALRDVAGFEAQIVGGATTACMVHGDSETEEGPALGVLALEHPAALFTFREGDVKSLRAAAQEMPAGSLGLVFIDPGGPLQRVAAALSREAQGHRLAGGGVAVEGGLLFDDDLNDAHAVGAFFPVPGRVLVAQSHQPLGKPMLVTRSEQRSLLEIDSRPAAEALSALNALPGFSPDALQFIGLGLCPQPGEPFDPDDFIEVPLLGVDEETAALETGVPVPEGHSISFTLRDGMGARRTLQTALAGLGAQGKPPPQFGLYFDCVSRGTTLYGVNGLDLGLIEKALGLFPLMAFRTSFELGPAGPATAMHLFTGVLALGDE